MLELKREFRRNQPAWSLFIEFIKLFQKVFLKFREDGEYRFRRSITFFLVVGGLHRSTYPMTKTNSQNIHKVCCIIMRWAAVYGQAEDMSSFGSLIERIETTAIIIIRKAILLCKVFKFRCNSIV